MAKKTPTFNYDLCISCSICVSVCPISSLEMSRTDIDELKKAYPELTERQCTGCGLCEKNCPMEAITMVEAAQCA